MTFQMNTNENTTTTITITMQKTAAAPPMPHRPLPATPAIRPNVSTAVMLLDAHFRRLEPELGKCLVGLDSQEIERVVLLKLNDVRRAYRDELNASSLIP